MSGETIVGLFDLQVNLTPDAIAVVSGDAALSYRELHSRANAIAEYLRWTGLQPEALVGVCFERSVSILVGLLGILKAGGAYLPLDPEYPKERLRFILQDAGVGLVLTDSGILEDSADLGATFLCLNRHWPLIARRETSLAQSECEASNLAYVIYTSGSTGRPKGVMVGHASLSNVIQSVTQELQVGREDVWVATSSFSFDIAVLELMLPLTVGARVVIASRREVADPHSLAALLDRWSATVMHATPACWQMLVSTGWAGKSNLTAVCGGENLRPKLAAALLPRVKSLWNAYGPTETTILSTLAHVVNGRVTIGRPINNTEIYILDTNGNEVPVGTRGEICIGGLGLARGYLGQPELTRKRFVPNPFTKASSRIYRTGDEGRRLSDGNFEYLGRYDFQVKVRGHRVELGEIESVLLEHSSVAQCVAVVAEDGSEFPGVWAFVVPESKDADFSEAELISFLQSKLPNYMVPARVVTTSEFPLTPTGKVDRQALSTSRPRPLRRALHVVRSTTEIERTLSATFEAVLGVGPVSPSDNFFELGGHSLLAVKLFSEVERHFGRRLPLATLFEAPTVEKLAGILQQPRPQTASVLIAVSAGGDLPPFFCVAPGGGGVLKYRSLAALLGPRQPFYTLQPQSVGEEYVPGNTVEKMAAEYIDAIRSVQAHGPYQLGGYSFGGTVAFEMAQQLSKDGEKVSLVALLDTHCRGRDSLSGSTYGKRLVDGIDYGIGKLIRTANRERLAYMRTLIGRWVRTAGPWHKTSAEETRVRSDTAAYQAYAPEPYKGRVVLFWSSQMAFRAYDDARLIWSEVVTDGLEVRRIAGHHLNVLDHPQVSVLAQEIAKCLSTGQRDHDSEPPVFEAAS